jgi:death-on-curing protein
MEVFLLLNGRELAASIDEQERLMLGIASGSTGREQLVAWLEAHSRRIS